MINRMENETAVIGECVRVMGGKDENGLIDIKPCVPKKSGKHLILYYHVMHLLCEATRQRLVHIPAKVMHTQK